MRNSLARTFLDTFFDLFPDEVPLFPVLDLKLKDQPSHIMARRAATTVVMNFLEALSTVLQAVKKDKLPAKPLLFGRDVYAKRLAAVETENVTVAEDDLLGQIEAIRAIAKKNKDDKMPSSERYARLRLAVLAFLRSLHETEVTITLPQQTEFKQLEEKTGITDTQTIAAFGEKMFERLRTLEAKTDGQLIAKIDTVGGAPASLADFYGYTFVDELKEEGEKLCPQVKSDRCTIM